MSKYMLAPRINTNDDRVEIVAWHVKPGEFVEEGQELVDLETSKAVVTINAEAEGYIHRMTPERTVVNVGDRLCVISETDEDVAEASFAPLPAALPIPPAQADASYGETRFSKAALSWLNQTGQSREDFVGRGLLTERRLRGDAAPVAKRPAKVTEIVRSQPKIDSTLRSEPVSLGKAAEIDALTTGEAGNINSAVTVYLNASGIREHIRRNGAFGGSLQPILLYELSRLLKTWPQFNAFFESGKIFYYDIVTVGLAIDLGQGLKVVTLHDSATMLPGQFHEKIGAFGLQYIENKIRPQDLVGSTFTVSDLSALNILQFHPLINGRQSAILGIGGDAMLPGEPITLTLTFDHRVANGRDASLFLNDLRNRLLSYELQGQVNAKVAEGPAPPATPAVRSCDSCGIDSETYYDQFTRDACMMVTVRQDGSFGAMCHRCGTGNL